VGVVPSRQPSGQSVPSDVAPSVLLVWLSQSQQASVQCFQVSGLRPIAGLEVSPPLPVHRDRLVAISVRQSTQQMFHYSALRQALPRRSAITTKSLLASFS